MLQYLINATMIWLLSLLIFDFFLRKESYHSYNRLYLLVTFLLGILLPVLQWQDAGIIYSTGAGQPVANAIVAKQAVIVAATIESTNIVSWEQWVLTVYYAGVAITSLLLMKDMIVLGRYFKSGARSKDGVWNIVETGKSHSPFSAFGYIFISSKNNYEPHELRMILTHEEQHGHALHFIDTLIMELGRIIFWFHPLVYLFQKRLLILHEYQADAAVENEPREYGQFLIQQSMLQTAPTLSHSFNRSPIKNRLFMLTRKSSLAAGFKRLIAVPLCIIFVFLFTENAISKDNKKEGNKLYYNGNVFELWSPQPLPDTFMVEDPVTGKMEMRIATIDSFPVKMNGKEIFREGELSIAEKEKYKATTSKELETYFFEKIQPAISKLDNGNYRIGNYLILDDKGKIVYRNEPSISIMKNARATDAEKTQMDPVIIELKKIIDNTNRKFTPVKRSRTPIIFRIEELFSMMTFHVKDHVVTYDKQ